MTHPRSSTGGNRTAQHPRTDQVRARNNKPRPVISVFGSSQARRRSRLYASAYQMGALLGAAGFDLMTGGYQGVMEAASEGGHAAGARVTGITLERFRDPVNRFVMREIRTADFYERLGWLVDRADGYVAMHGGIGTLTEVTFTWQAVVLGVVPPRPLILVGERWRKIFQSFRGKLIGGRAMYAPVVIVTTPVQAIERLLKHFQLPPIDYKAWPIKPSKAPTTRTTLTPKVIRTPSERPSDDAI